MQAALFGAGFGIRIDIVVVCSYLTAHDVVGCSLSLLAEVALTAEVALAGGGGTVAVGVQIRVAHLLPL